MDIEKYKSKYLHKELGVRVIDIPTIEEPQTQAILPAELIAKVKSKILVWANDKSFKNLEIKEVKDIASIINGLDTKAPPPPPQVNVLVQNFMDGQVDDC